MRYVCPTSEEAKEYKKVLYSYIMPLFPYGFYVYDFGLAHPDAYKRWNTIQTQLQEDYAGEYLIHHIDKKCISSSFHVSINVNQTGETGVYTMTFDDIGATTSEFFISISDPNSHDRTSRHILNLFMSKHGLTEEGIIKGIDGLSKLVRLFKYNGTFGMH